MKSDWPRKMFASLIDDEAAPSAAVSDLSKELEQARREWIGAQNYYNSVSDTDLVDHAVYLMQAAEKKYNYLLKKARREGITQQPYH